MSDLQNVPYSRFLHVKSLEIGVIDEKEDNLKLVIPSIYSSTSPYDLGQLVEYDEENQSIEKIGLYRNYSEEEINEISNLFEKYTQKFIVANNSNNEKDAKEIETVLRGLALYLNLIPYMQTRNNNGIKR